MISRFWLGFGILLFVCLSLPKDVSAAPLPLVMEGAILSAPGLARPGLPLSIHLVEGKATVVVFLSAKCPCSAAHESALRKLYESYASQGVRFIGIHSNQDESAAESREHFGKSALPFPVLDDSQAALADRFGALKTPHAFILSSTGAILYAGGVDDSRHPENARHTYLADALAAVTSGTSPAMKETRALGCVIKRKP